MTTKTKLTLNILKEEAKTFCQKTSKEQIKELHGVTDGKAVGTFIEHYFLKYISNKYDFIKGNSAKGIDLPLRAIKGTASLKETIIKRNDLNLVPSSLNLSGTEIEFSGLAGR